jgi:hypothetical protein
MVWVLHEKGLALSAVSPAQSQANLGDRTAAPVARPDAKRKPAESR